MYYLVFLTNPHIRYNGMEFNTFEAACDYIKNDIKPDTKVVPRPREDMQEYYRWAQAHGQQIQQPIN